MRVVETVPTWSLVSARGTPLATSLIILCSPKSASLAADRALRIHQEVDRYNHNFSSI